VLLLLIASFLSNSVEISSIVMPGIDGSWVGKLEKTASAFRAAVKASFRVFGDEIRVCRLISGFKPLRKNVNVTEMLSGSVELFSSFILVA
jgi:hypothetical protein